MMSKSSFLGSIKENNKRRLWVWAISVLVFMLIIPLFLALRINLEYLQAEWLTENYGMAAAKEIIRSNLLEEVKSVLGFSAMFVVPAVFLAVVNAVQGFSWLYSRKKIDFYMGMPVKRAKRFLVIWLNGILIYLIPYVLGTALCMMIAAGNHGLDAGVSQVIAQAFFAHLLLFLCVYHMAILAVMLTGNMVITGMGFLVFCLYEWLVRRVDYVYKARFFRYFSDTYSSTKLEFSPFAMYSELANGPTAIAAQAKTFALMLGFAAVIGALSYLCYRKRPAEAAGKALVFPVTKPVIKILLVVPIALAWGDLIANDVSYGHGGRGIGYVVLAFVLAVVLVSAVIQVLYEFDIRGVFHQKKHIVISGVIVALIFLVYRFDLLRYDAYVPDPEKVESIAFVPSGYERVSYCNMWIEPGEGAIGAAEYAGRYMYLKNVDDVCRMAGYSMERYEEVVSEDEESYAHVDNVEIGDSQWYSGIVIYRMKGGREVERRIWIDVKDETTGEYLDRIIGSKEFKEGYLMGASGRLAQMVTQNDEYEVSAYYGNLVYEQKMRQTELLELLECYQADMENFHFTRVKESVPEGVITVTFEKEIQNRYRGTSLMELGINIYPFFEKSIACLKKYGYYMERQLDVADIDRIYIINQNSEVNRELQKLQKAEKEAKDTIGTMPQAVVDGQAAGYEIDTRGYADYTDKEDIEKLADCIYTEEMMSERWDDGPAPDYDYSVYVYFKADSEMNRKYGACAYYNFLEGEVPAFVQEDTAYQMTK